MDDEPLCPWPYVEPDCTRTEADELGWPLTAASVAAALAELSLLGLVLKEWLLLHKVVKMFKGFVPLHIFVRNTVLGSMVFRLQTPIDLYGLRGDIPEWYGDFLSNTLAAAAYAMCWKSAFYFAALTNMNTRKLALEPPQLAAYRLAQTVTVSLPVVGLGLTAAPFWVRWRTIYMIEMVMLATYVLVSPFYCYRVWKAAGARDSRERRRVRRIINWLMIFEVVASITIVILAIRVYNIFIERPTQSAPVVGFGGLMLRSLIQIMIFTANIVMLLATRIGYLRALGRTPSARLQSLLSADYLPVRSDSVVSAAGMPSRPAKVGP